MPTEVPVLAVVGATGTGKSELALRLAEHLGGEVVNADAMQLYRGMDIGTAKLSSAERRGIPHHQLDVLDVTQEASVAAYQRGARADIDDIRSRGRVAILVGGSGLYVRAALDRLEIPPTDASVRSHLEAEALRLGTPTMYAALQERDPVAASAIEPGNTRRIVRALEVIELTGRPFSATMPTRDFLTPTVVIGLTADRPTLDDRLDARVERMWAHGMVDEVRHLAENGLRDGRTARTAIGYAQALAQVDDLLDEAAAKEQTVLATRRFARRQQSWFRPDDRITWFDTTDVDVGLGDALEGATVQWRGMTDNG